MVSGAKPSQLTSIRESLERLTAMMEESPDFVTSERMAVINAVDEEMKVLIAALDAQRLAVTSELHSERDLLLAIAQEHWDPRSSESRPST